MVCKTMKSVTKKEINIRENRAERRPADSRVVFASHRPQGGTPCLEPLGRVAEALMYLVHSLIGTFPSYLIFHLHLHHIPYNHANLLAQRPCRLHPMWSHWVFKAGEKTARAI